MTDKKLDPNSIKNVMDSLLDAFTKEAHESPEYKELEEEHRHFGLGHLFRLTEHRMAQLALHCIDLVEEDLGRNLTKEESDFLFALPYRMKELENKIEKEEGSPGCTDKAYSRTVKSFRDKTLE